VLKGSFESSRCFLRLSFSLLSCSDIDGNARQNAPTIPARLHLPGVVDPDDGTVRLDEADLDIIRHTF
jgi:hypothetical protein